MKVRLTVAKFTMDSRRADLKHSISDSLRTFEGVEDMLERQERKASDVLIERSTLLIQGQMGEWESWDPLMEGGRRELPELAIPDRDMDDAARGMSVHPKVFATTFTYSE